MNKISHIIEYRDHYITIYTDGSASVAGMKYDHIGLAKEVVDKILNTKIYR